MDYSKVLLAGHLASGFFAALPLPVRIVLGTGFVVLFLSGWFCLPGKKGGE